MTAMAVDLPLLTDTGAAVQIPNRLQTEEADEAEGSRHSDSTWNEGRSTRSAVPGRRAEHSENS
jgi:hypothetical protein